MSERLAKAATEMLEAWERAEFGSQHHTITGVLAAAAELRKSKAQPAEPSEPPARGNCPECGGTGGYTPAYVSGGEIIGPDGCVKCDGTGDVPPAGDELPAGLTIKGKAVEVHQSRYGKGWFISSTAGDGFYLDKSGKWLGTLETSKLSVHEVNEVVYWPPTRTAAIEAAIAAADLPEGCSITAGEDYFAAVTPFGTSRYSTASKAYMACKAAAERERVKCQECGGAGEIQEGTGQSNSEGGEDWRAVLCPACTPPQPAEPDGLSNLRAVWLAHVEATEKCNAAIPDPTKGTSAERELYKERWKVKNEATDLWWSTALAFARSVAEGGAGEVEQPDFSNTFANINDTCRSRGFSAGPSGSSTEDRVIALAQGYDQEKARAEAAEAQLAKAKASAENHLQAWKRKAEITDRQTKELYAAVARAEKAERELAEWQEMHRQSASTVSRQSGELAAAAARAFQAERERDRLRGEMITLAKIAALSQKGKQ